MGQARAVAQMLEEGYTLDGAAAALGWSRQLVSARAKILELPESAQALLDTGVLPVSAVDTLLRIAAVSPELCQAVVATVADGHTRRASAMSSSAAEVRRSLMARFSNAQVAEAVQPFWAAMQAGEFIADAVRAGRHLPQAEHALGRCLRRSAPALRP